MNQRCCRTNRQKIKESKVRAQPQTWEFQVCAYFGASRNLRRNHMYFEISLCFPSPKSKNIGTWSGSKSKAEQVRAERRVKSKNTFGFDLRVTFTLIILPTILIISSPKTIIWNLFQLKEEKRWREIEKYSLRSLTPQQFITVTVHFTVSYF